MSEACCRHRQHNSSRSAADQQEGERDDAVRPSFPLTFTGNKLFFGSFEDNADRISAIRCHYRG